MKRTKAKLIRFAARCETNVKVNLLDPSVRAQVECEERAKREGVMKCALALAQFLAKHFSSEELVKVAGKRRMQIIVDVLSDKDMEGMKSTDVVMEIA